MILTRPLCMLVTLLLFVPLLAFSAEQRVVYKIKEQRISAKPPTLKVKQGDSLLIEWSSDEAVSIHLHGYDVLLKLTPSIPGQMKFVAHSLGRFPVSAHAQGKEQHGKQHAEVPLLYLEVLPQ